MQPSSKQHKGTIGQSRPTPSLGVEKPAPGQTIAPTQASQEQPNQAPPTPVEPSQPQSARSVQGAALLSAEPAGNSAAPNPPPAATDSHQNQSAAASGYAPKDHAEGTYTASNPEPTPNNYNPEQSPQPAQPESPAPPVDNKAGSAANYAPGKPPTKRKLKSMWLLIPIILLLVGAVAAWYFMIKLPNDSDYVWTRIENTIKDGGHSAAKTIENRAEKAGASGRTKYDVDRPMTFGSKVTMDTGLDDIGDEGVSESSIYGSYSQNYFTLRAITDLSGSDASAEAMIKFDDSEIETIDFMVDGLTEALQALERQGAIAEQEDINQLDDLAQVLDGQWFNIDGEELGLQLTPNQREGICDTTDMMAAQLSVDTYMSQFGDASEIADKIFGEEDEDEFGIFSRRDSGDDSTQLDGQDGYFMYTIDIDSQKLQDYAREYSTKVQQDIIDSLSPECQEQLSLDEGMTDTYPPTDSDYIPESINIWYNKSTRSIQQATIKVDGSLHQLRVTGTDGDFTTIDYTFASASSELGEEPAARIKVKNFENILSGDFKDGAEFVITPSSDPAGGIESASLSGKIKEGDGKLDMELSAALKITDLADNLNMTLKVSMEESKSIYSYDHSSYRGILDTQVESSGEMIIKAEPSEEGKTVFMESANMKLDIKGNWLAGAGSTKQQSMSIQADMRDGVDEQLLSSPKDSKDFFTQFPDLKPSTTIDSAFGQYPLINQT